MTPTTEQRIADERIAEIEARLDAATPGPWQVVTRDMEQAYGFVTGTIVCPSKSDILDGHRVFLEFNRHYTADADAALIENVPTDLRFLLSQLRAARKDAEDVRARWLNAVQDARRAGEITGRFDASRAAQKDSVRVADLRIYAKQLEAEATDRAFACAEARPEMAELAARLAGAVAWFLELTDPEIESPASSHPEGHTT